MTDSHSPSSAGSAVLLGDLLDECISVEICTVEEGTKQHTRRYLSKEDIAVLANAVNHSCDVAQAAPAWRLYRDDGSYTVTNNREEAVRWGSIGMVEETGRELRSSQLSPAATVETNSPEQDRESDCKTNPESTGHSPKERGERVLPHLSAGNGDDLSRRARELADEPVIGTEGRKLLRQMATEIEDLRHDIDRHIQIATDIANEPQPLGVWQPIETAPKDGTPIEACNTRHPSHAPVIVRWDGDGLSDDVPEPHWCDAATRDGEALYYNQNYFDFWKPTTALPRPHGGGK